jgi:hypothetical protein
LTPKTQQSIDLSGSYPKIRAEMLSFVVISKIAAHGTHKNATIGHIMAGGKGVATGLHPYHQTPTVKIHGVKERRL